MNFKISNVEHYISPRELNVDEILKIYGISLADIKKTMMDAVFVYRNLNEGFQKELAEQLKTVIEKYCQGMGRQIYRGSNLYSSAMRETPDVAIGLKGHSKKIFIEIEFRPNEHKDIVKFLIGHKKQTLELGILIAAIDRKVIKKGYTTMPQYKKCIQTIEALQSDCPILVMGIDGTWVPA